MKRRAGITRIDLVVTLACIVFVLANVQVISAGGRERSKREVCMANLRALTAAWTMYAEDNAGKLVNGAPTVRASCPGSPSCQCKAAAPDPGSWDYMSHNNEVPWIGAAWNQTGWSDGIPASECCQKCAMETGALWKYVQDYDIYHCPTGQQGELVTYTIVDSMNGKYQFTGASPAMLIKNTNQLIKPALQLVFIEEGRLTPDSYAVFYNREQWFDPPCVRHGDGTNVSFADGHCARWMWKSKATVIAGNTQPPVYNWTPPADDFAALNDLYRVQIGCWGQLVYTPSVPVE